MGGRGASNTNISQGATQSTEENRQQADRTNNTSNSCGCFLGNLFSSSSNTQPKMQTIEKGHLEEVKFRVLEWEE